MPPGRDTLGTVADLHDSAARLTGLDDFGPDDYREALAVLLDSYVREASLTPWGNKVHRAQLRGALVARQLSEASWRYNPTYADTRIERPIFVTGLPRTGTTALHRLLCADPEHQGLEMWLAESPQPRPPRQEWDLDPVFQLLQQGFQQHQQENPEFSNVHYTAADMVEECWYLLRQSIMSISYASLAHLPSYSRWLDDQDWTEAYRRHQSNLRLIGMGDTRRWVLKNPSHLFALDALLTVYPDALIIMTHRDPSTAMASVSSLTARATAGQSDLFQGDVIGKDQLGLWAHGIERFMTDRARYPQSHFADVHYEDFVLDPIATVESIYDHFGLNLTERGRSAMTALNTGGKADRRQSHHYRLAEFGLHEAEVNERFANYIRTYR